MSYESDLIKKITGGIGAIKRKEKTPEEAGLGKFLNALKATNEGQYDDYLKKYKEAVESIKPKT
jgi:hypothetical protein